MTTDLLQLMTEFGAAGLIGLLWVLERSAARRRDRELTEAHQRVIHDREGLDVLVHLVRQNTQAIAQFAASMRELSRTLERLDEHVRGQAA